MTAARLWHDEADLVALRQHLAAGHPHLIALLDVVRGIADVPIEEALDPEPDHHGQFNTVHGQYPTACAVAYALTGESAYAERARRGALYGLKAWTNSDLGVAGRTQQAVIVHQCCADAWSEADAAGFMQLLARCAEAINRVGKGNPHQVGNNWWAVTHGAALTAALISHGQPNPAGGSYDHSDLISRCGQRIDAFTHHFGDAGLYHEGLGYQIYTTSHLLPAIVAWGRNGGPDLLARYSHLRRMGASLASITCARRNTTDVFGTDEEPGWGTAISWNDAGQGWGGGLPMNLLLALAPPAEQAALAAWYDRMHGHASPERSFAMGYAGLYFAAFSYPYDAAAQDPLPTHVCDGRQGLWVARDRYHDQDDAILGVYAKATHVGGHKQNDAGSVRLLALDHDWIIGGGQARGKAEWQSVVCPADADDRKGGTNRGLMMWSQSEPERAIAAMDLRWSSGAYHERYVAAQWATESSPLVLSRLDIVDDHKAGRGWWWTQSFAPYLDCAISDDGFVLTADDGASMQVRFLGHQPDAITVERMPESKRSYSSGGTVVYPGRPFIRAVFAGGRSLQHCYAVATVQRGAAPAITSLDAGVGVQIGDQPLARPFGAAVPAAFQLGTSRNLCLQPSGLADWDFTIPNAAAD